MRTSLALASRATGLQLYGHASSFGRGGSSVVHTGAGPSDGPRPGSVTEVLECQELLDGARQGTTVLKTKVQLFAAADEDTATQC